MLVAYTPGRTAVAVGPEGLADSPADTLEKLLEELPRGSVPVADAEFSGRRCLELLLEKLKEGALAGFLVRANRRWHAELWGEARERVPRRSRARRIREPRTVRLARPA